MANGAGVREMMRAGVAMDDMDKETAKEEKIVFGGILLAAAAFFLWFGTYGALHDSSRRVPDLINKAVLAGPMFLYFSLCLILGPPDGSERSKLKRWQWMKVQWQLMLGCVVFVALCLAAWVSYLHHHGFAHVS